MIFTPSRLDGVVLIELEKRGDDRGFFARTWCLDEFAQHGLNTNVVQINTGLSIRSGTLRGLHWQEAPHAEVKIVRCVRGALYDVVVDVRPDSPTCGQWESFEMTADNGRALYVPEGFAHGYQTLVNETELSYMTTCRYAPNFARGARFDDPALKISWPLPVTSLSQQDRTWPDFTIESTCLETEDAT